MDRLGRAEIEVRDRASIERAVESARIASGCSRQLHDHLTNRLPAFRWLCSEVRSALDSEGFAVLREVGSGDRVLLAVAGIAGRAVKTGNGAPGVVIYDVVPAQEPDGDLPGSKTRDAFALHTDGTGLLDPPHHVLLGCVTAVPDCGYSLILSASEVLDLVRRQADLAVVELLREPVYVVRLADASGRRTPTPVPVVAGPVGAEYIRYWPSMVDAVEATPRHRAALQLVADVIDNEVSPVRFWLGAGDALLIDNRRLLHGRTAIGAGLHRHLKRLKIYPVAALPR